MTDFVKQFLLSMVKDRKKKERQMIECKDGVIATVIELREKPATRS